MTTITLTEIPTMNNLYKRMKEAGFPREFVRDYILPSWWDDEIGRTETGFSQAAFLVARRVGADFEMLFDSSAPVRLDPVNCVKFKSVATSKNSVSSASVCVRIAAIIAEAVSTDFQRKNIGTASYVRQCMMTDFGPVVNLDSLIGWCWAVGIPVLHFGHLPAGKPQAMCLSSRGRPVIFLCENRDISAWQAFHLAHEIGHICLGHMSEDGSLLMDDSIDRHDTSKEEAEANAFAAELLLGRTDAKFKPSITYTSVELAAAAQSKGFELQIDPGAIILNSLFYDTQNRTARAMLAAKLIEPDPAAITRINQFAFERIDWEEISSENKEYITQLCGLGRAHD